MARVALAVAVLAAVAYTGSAHARPKRAQLVYQSFYLSMNVKGCPCKGKLTGTYSAVGTVTDRGSVKGTFKAQPTLAKPTLSGTTTLKGPHGTITIAYTGRLIPTSPPHPDGSVDYGIGTGTWRISGATGGYTKLGSGRGKFYATLAKNVVHAGYLPA